MVTHINANQTPHQQTSDVAAKRGTMSNIPLNTSSFTDPYHDPSPVKEKHGGHRPTVTSACSVITRQTDLPQARFRTLRLRVPHHHLASTMAYTAAYVQTSTSPQFRAHPNHLQIQPTKTLVLRHACLIVKAAGHHPSQNTPQKNS